MTPEYASGIDPERKLDPPERSSPESPPETEPGEIVLRKAPLDAEGLIRDAEAMRRREEEAAKREADEGWMREAVAEAYQIDKSDGVADVEEFAFEEELEKDMEGVAKKLREAHGVDVVKGPPSLGERLKLLMSDDARQLLKRYRELDRAHKEVVRRVRILRRAIKPETEEESTRRQKTPPEARM